jgi:hypothetical protein
MLRHGESGDWYGSFQVRLVPLDWEITDASAFDLPSLTPLAFPLNHPCGLLASQGHKVRGEPPSRL